MLVSTQMIKRQLKAKKNESIKHLSTLIGVSETDKKKWIEQEEKLFLSEIKQIEQFENLIDRIKVADKTIRISPF